MSGALSAQWAKCGDDPVAGPQPVRGQLLCGALLGTIRREAVPRPEPGSWDVGGLLETEVSGHTRPVLSTSNALHHASSDGTPHTLLSVCFLEDRKHLGGT